MRKDSINSKALEQAYLIYKEHGHTIQDFDFSHSPTDYARGTVMEPENTSKLKEAFNELTREEVTSDGKYDTAKGEMDSLLKRIDEQKLKIQNSRRTGNFDLFHRLMNEMNSMLKQKQKLDAKLSVYSPAGNVNVGELSSRAGDKGSYSYTEMQEIGNKIEELEAALQMIKGE